MKLGLKLTEREACVIFNALNVAQRELGDRAQAQYALANNDIADVLMLEVSAARDVMARINEYIMALDNARRAGAKR